jgi:hypothetical protein
MSIDQATATLSGGINLYKGLILLALFHIIIGCCISAIYIIL